jgi:photosystem II stability/assembly factor-like uncharacterized protein
MAMSLCTRALPLLATGLALALLASCGGGGGGGDSQVNRLTPAPSAAPMSVAEGSVWVDRVITLTGNCAGTGTVRYRWVFDDGKEPLEGTQAKVNHSFDAAGPHTVQLTCTDDSGQSTVTTLHLQVEAATFETVADLACAGDMPGQGWCRQSPRSMAPWISVVAVLGQDVLLALSTAGQVLRSTDRGLTWLTVDVPGVHALAIGSAPPVAKGAVSKVAWALGGPGGIFKTTDGGLSWARQDSGIDTTLHHLHVVDEQTAWAANDQQVLRTVDGGLHWVPLFTATTDARPLSHAFTAWDADHAWLGLGTDIWATKDGGKAWQLFKVPKGAVNALASGSATSLWAGTLGGLVYQSADRGASWMRRDLGLPSSTLVGLMGLLATDAQTAWQLGFSVPADGSGNKALAAYTTDLGQRWQTLLDLPQDVRVNTAGVWQGQVKWLFASGEVFDVQDGRATRVSGSSQQALFPTDLAATSDKVAWISTLDGHILRTVNGGLTWVDQPWGNAAMALRGISASSDQSAWAILGTTGLVGTQDGETWRPALADQGRMLSVHNVTPTVVWAAGNAGVVWHSMDGGQRWDARSTGASAPLIAIRARDALEAWALRLDTSTNRGTVLRTTDGNTTWSTVNLPGLATVQWASVSLPGPKGVYLLGNQLNDAGVTTQTVLLGSADGGVSWANIALPLQAQVPATGFTALDDQHFWLLQGGEVWRSKDGGQHWLLQAFTNDACSLLSASPTNPKVAWCAGNKLGIIYRTITGGTLQP